MTTQPTTATRRSYTRRPFCETSIPIALVPRVACDTCGKLKRHHKTKYRVLADGSFSPTCRDCEKAGRNPDDAPKPAYVEVKCTIPGCTGTRTVARANAPHTLYCDECSRAMSNWRVREAKRRARERALEPPPQDDFSDAVATSHQSQRVIDGWRALDARWAAGVGVFRGCK